MIDAYADRLRSPELLHLWVEGFSVEVLISQTTCGDTGYGNALVVPPQLWPQVMDRLDEPFVKGYDAWRRQDRRRSYIANQCVPEFQVAYLNRDPKFLDGLARPGLMLEVNSDNDIVTSVFASGVLPERIRATFVGHLIDFCLNGTDGAVLWRKAFPEREYARDSSEGSLSAGTIRTPSLSPLTSSLMVSKVSSKTTLNCARPPISSAMLGGNGSTPTRRRTNRKLTAPPSRRLSPTHRHQTRSAASSTIS